MEPNRYGLDGEPLSSCSLESDPVTGLSMPIAERSKVHQVVETRVGIALFSGLFIGLVCFLVSQSNMVN